MRCTGLDPTPDRSVRLYQLPDSAPPLTSIVGGLAEMGWYDHAARPRPDIPHVGGEVRVDAGVGTAEPTLHIRKPRPAKRVNRQPERREFLPWHRQVPELAGE